jgi:hypothetical protein
MSRTAAVRWATKIDGHVEIIACGNGALEKMQRLHSLSGWTFGPTPEDVVHRATIRRKMAAPVKRLDWKLSDVARARKIWQEIERNGSAAPILEGEIFSLKDLATLRNAA